MSIFKIKDGGIMPIKEEKIDLEKDLQKITEDNLGEIFGLKFVSTEFSVDSFCLDTLAFDEETKSFVIIEYKKDRSFSVIDQGFAYLSLMLHKKSDFILEYNEKVQGNLKRDDVNWQQSRVLFLASSFTDYQQHAINFKDLPIELWEVKKFDNNTILFNQLKALNAKESINKISGSKEVEKVSKEIKKYTIDDHFKDGWDKSRERFDILRQNILDIDSRIVENPNPKDYIGYKIGNNNVVAVHIYKSKLQVDLGRVEKKDLKDPINKVKDVRWREYKWPKLCIVNINSVGDLDYAVFLIKQVYNKFYK